MNYKHTRNANYFIKVALVYVDKKHILYWQSAIAGEGSVACFWKYFLWHE